MDLLEEGAGRGLNSSKVYFFYTRVRRYLLSAELQTLNYQCVKLTCPVYKFRMRVWRLCGALSLEQGSPADGDTHGAFGTLDASAA